MRANPTPILPVVPLHRDAPSRRAGLEEAWRRHVAEITRLSLQALDTIHAPDDDAGTSRIGELGEATYLIAAERQLLDEVEAALRRVDDGTYGICPQCGREIPAEQLDRAPAARYCGLCQR